MKTARIYAFGDSQVYGAWDSEGGWCDRLKRKVHTMTMDESSGVKLQMFNLGIGGEPSRALLSRMRNELEARHKPDWPATIIIGTGENDARRHMDGRVQIPIEEFRNNLEQIIAIARGYTDRIILIGLTLPEHDPQYFKDSYFSHDLLIEYNDALIEIAHAHGLPVVDVIGGLAASTEPVFYKDGIHLIAHSHQILAGLVWEKLEPMLAADGTTQVLA